MFEFHLSKELKEKKTRLAFKEDIEFHEILLDSLAQKKEKESGVSEKRIEVLLLRKILQGFFIFCFLILSLLFIKTFQLQIIEGKKFSARAQDNKFVFQQIQAERGVIYDNNLKQLVFNRPSFDLVLNRSDLPKEENEKARVFKETAAILKKDIDDLKKEIEESEEPTILISEGLPYQELILLESKINELQGFQIQNNPVRDYKDKEAFSHLLGYTAKIKSEELNSLPELYSINDYVGRSGIEKSYEGVLRKNPGKIRAERDVLGNIISREIVQSPESGKSLVLWLDSDLQQKIKTELERKLQVIGSKKGVAIALNPKTGGVLALVSLPGFDNNLFQKGADAVALKNLLEDKYQLEPLFNRAVSGRYLTGSTIKPLIASAALEEKIINPEKKISDPGYIEVPHQYNPEIVYKFKDWAVHGPTDLRKAIAESCNVYFYTVGGGYKDQEGLGPTRIKKYLELFGWGGLTGIDLPGETEGFIPDKQWKKERFKEGWWDGDTYNLSIGQGFLQITPLEVVTAFSAIANGGKLLQPQVVQKIINTSIGKPEVLEEFQLKIIRENFISPQNLQIVREGMRQAVTGENTPMASAVILNSLSVEAAAKTGTAELGGNRYHNWVTVFAPYDNPEIVLTVMIEDVKGVQAAALPVAKAVLEWYFTR